MVGYVRYLGGARIPRGECSTLLVSENLVVVARMVYMLYLEGARFFLGSAQLGREEVLVVLYLHALACEKITVRRIHLFRKGIQDNMRNGIVLEVFDLIMG